MEKEIAMDKDLFQHRFIIAMNLAREFGQKYITEDLPEDIRLDLSLNDSHDRYAHPALKLYPEDSSEEMAAAVYDISADEASNVLWREGYVPCWIDLSVKAIRRNCTIIGLSVCGRFTHQEEHLYHIKEGQPPFHVVGPGLPPHDTGGVPFSIHRVKQCRTPEDFSDAQENAEKVIALELSAALAMAAPLAARSQFPNLENLTLESSIWGQQSFQSLGVPSTIKNLSLSFGKSESFDLRDMAYFQNLESLTLNQVPSRLIGIEEVRSVLENLNSFSLTAVSEVHADCEVTFADLLMFYLDLPVFPDWISRCRNGKYLMIGCREGDEKSILSFLEKSLDSLASLGLRSTPVSDDVFKILLNAPQLTNVDLTETKVTMEAINTFEEQRPDVFCQPQYLKGPDGRLIERKKMQ